MCQCASFFKSCHHAVLAPGSETAYPMYITKMSIRVPSILSIATLNFTLVIIVSLRRYRYLSIPPPILSAISISIIRSHHIVLYRYRTMADRVKNSRFAAQFHPAHTVDHVSATAQSPITATGVLALALPLPAHR